VPVCPVVASAADCDGGSAAGFELLCVGEFAATTTNRIAAEAPRTPGNQFFECSQSRRGPHRCMLNSHHFKARAAAAIMCAPRPQLFLTSRFRGSRSNKCKCSKVREVQATWLAGRDVAVHQLPSVEVTTPDTGHGLCRIDHYPHYAPHGPLSISNPAGRSVLAAQAVRVGAGCEAAVFRHALSLL
jgi:hypothetical protein